MIKKVLSLFLLICPILIEAVNYFGFIPSYVGNINNNSITKVNGNCFTNIEISYNNFNISISINGRERYICSETFIFGNNHRLVWQTYFLEGEHIYELENVSKEEIRDIDYYGLNIFYLSQGIIESTSNLIGTLKMFKGDYVEEENLNFLKNKMNINYDPVFENLTLDPDKIESGDMLAITRLDGLDPVIMWGTGSHIGHSAIALRINGTLYICESTDKNPLGESYWPPPYGIIKTPYDKWIKFAKKADYIVSVLRLKSPYFEKFQHNIDKAIKLFNRLEGLPYGYRNFLFGWIDTESYNFPGNLSKQFLINFFSGLQRDDNIAKFVKRFIDEGLSKRLNLDLDLPLKDIIDLTIDQNISIYKLLTYPEKDEWIYSDGYSYVCNTFVLRLYKEVGIFDEILDLVEVSEFTPRDTYEIDIFDKNWHPLSCQNKKKLCQILGKYEMDLPNFSSIKMYPFMNELCPSTPPSYPRPMNC